MRKRHSLALLIAVLIFVGCASTPERVAYTSIDAAVTAVQTSVSAFKQMKASGQIADADGSKEAAVRDAYAKFQKTANLAVDLAQDITQKDNALKIINDAAADAAAVIYAFTGKKP